MALPASIWYVRDTGTLGYSAVTKWSAGATLAAGVLRRQNTAPTVGNERVFATIVAGTTSNPTEPTWVLTKGAKTTDNTVTWIEVTGQAGVNGDLTNCPNWTAAKSNVISQGYIIQNNAGTFLFICTTAGTAGSGSEPTWNTTAGQTTSDNTVTWTSLGAVGGFGNWAAPHARLANALASTWAAAGDTVYVGSDHNASQSAQIAIAGTGTNAKPIFVYSIGTGTIPPTSVTAGAAETSTSSNVAICATAVTLYVYGVTFSSNTGPTVGGGNLNPVAVYLDTCTLKLTGSGAAQVMAVGGGGASSGGQKYEFRSCTFTLGNAGQSIRLGLGDIDFIAGTFFATGTLPTTAFTTSAGVGTAVIRDSDLSAVTGNILDLSSTTSSGIVLFENSKLNASATVTTGTPTGQGGIRCRLHNCDSTTTDYRLFVKDYLGTIQQSTSVTRSGGASDGTTAISWQIVSSANTYTPMPFESEEIATFNTATGSPKTATIYLTCASSLTNADVWVEWEYPGSPSTPIGTSDLSSRVALLGSSSPLTADVTSTWTGGLGNNYMISATFTPQLKGVIKARVNVGKASLTFNVDPYISLV